VRANGVSNAPSSCSHRPKTHLIGDQPQPLLIDPEALHLLQDDLGENVQLVVVSIDGEEDAVSLGLEGVAQAGELGIVGVLDQRVLDELGK
jgi:hypothetical protein